MFTIKVATFMSHELTCPGVSWLSSCSAFWFKCSLPVFIPGHTTPPGTVFVAFTQLLTQVAGDVGDSGRMSADSDLKKWSQWLCSSEMLKSLPLPFPGRFCNTTSPRICRVGGALT